MLVYTKNQHTDHGPTKKNNRIRKKKKSTNEAQMLLKLKRIKRQSRYQPMNEGHPAMRPQMLLSIKVKKNKKADFKTYSRSFRERERERERD